MINFIIHTDINNNLVIYDYTIDSTLTTENSINSWELVVTSSKLKKVVKLDIINYIYTSRELNELFKITPEKLGLKDSFTDGLYKFEMFINNTSVKTHYTILYNNIYYKLKELLEKYNYTFTISNPGYINYIDDDSTYKTEEIRILSGLINELQTYQFTSYSDVVETTVNDILEKAYRIAEIIE